MRPLDQSFATGTPARQSEQERQAIDEYLSAHKERIEREKAERLAQAIACIGSPIVPVKGLRKSARKGNVRGTEANSARAREQNLKGALKDNQSRKESADAFNAELLARYNRMGADRVALVTLATELRCSRTRLYDRLARARRDAAARVA